MPFPRFSSTIPRMKMPPSIHWFQFAVNYLVGLVLGAAGGFRLMPRLTPLKTPWQDPFESQSGLLLMAGAALIGAAVVAHYGNRLWFGADNLAVSHSPVRTDGSRLITCVSAVAGGVFILTGWLG